jgi:hypothetical protein
MLISRPSKCVDHQIQYRNKKPVPNEQIESCMNPSSDISKISVLYESIIRHIKNLISVHTYRNSTVIIGNVVRHYCFQSNFPRLACDEAVRGNALTSLVHYLPYSTSRFRLQYLLSTACAVSLLHMGTHRLWYLRTRCMLVVWRMRFRTRNKYQYFYVRLARRPASTRQPTMHESPHISTSYWYGYNAYPFHSISSPSHIEV